MPSTPKPAAAPGPGAATSSDGREKHAKSYFFQRGNDTCSSPRTSQPALAHRAPPPAAALVMPWPNQRPAPLAQQHPAAAPCKRSLFSCRALGRDARGGQKSTGLSQTQPDPTPPASLEPSRQAELSTFWHPRPASCSCLAQLI